MSACNLPPLIGFVAHIGSRSENSDRHAHTR
jgi:hypothetical protein